MTCPKCGRNVTDLAKHFKQVHKVQEESELISSISEAKLLLKSQKQEEKTLFDLEIDLYKDHTMKTLGYKEENRYHPKHFQNLERFGKNIRKL